MNKTQKKIIGWAMVVIGLMMVTGVVIDSKPRTNLLGNTVSEPGAMFRRPALYFGLALAVAGVGVLGGYKRRIVNMPQIRIRIIGWALVFIGVLVQSGAIIKNLAESTFFGASPFFYAGSFLIVVGAVVLAGDSKGGKSAEQTKKDHQVSMGME